MFPKDFTMFLLVLYAFTLFLIVISKGFAGVLYGFTFFFFSRFICFIVSSRGLKVVCVFLSFLWLHQCL